MSIDRLKAGIRDLFLHYADDPKRQGIVGTPERVEKAFSELFSGLSIDPDNLLKSRFEEELSNPDGIILETDISFVSVCEHHLLPFVGVAHFGYIPNGNCVVGASKIARLVDCFARRPQIQERLGKQIVECFDKNLKPKGCMLVLIARHQCMSCRGVKQPDTKFVTSNYTGCFESEVTRNEFLSLITLSSRV